MIRILVPLDGSNVAEQALKHALSIAKAFPAELILLRVNCEPDKPMVADTDNINFAFSRHQAHMYLHDLVTQYATENVQIRGEVNEGDPGGSIVKFMRKHSPDLVVLTRYGGGHAYQFGAGDTAEKIISGADCSVLLLDPRKAIDPEENHHRILVPIDDSGNSGCAIAVVTAIAETWDAIIVVTHQRGVAPTERFTAYPSRAVANG